MSLDDGRKASLRVSRAGRSFVGCYNDARTACGDRRGDPIEIVIVNRSLGVFQNVPDRKHHRREVVEPAPAMPRGRPRDPAKQEALLDAARQLFLTFGPEATMEQVIAQARVSRTTLYANYPDKVALLEAMFARESRRIVSEEFANAPLSSGIEEALTRFGEGLLGFLSDPDMLGFERLIPLVANAYPTLATRFFAAGPGRAHDILCRLLGQGRDRGELVVDDIEEAASDLLGLWQGFLRIQLSFGQARPPVGKALKRHVARGVRQFMRLYGAIPK